MQPLFFDHITTTPPCPEAVTECARFTASEFHSPWSGFVAGNSAREALLAARARFRKMAGAPETTEVIFCGGGSEANNLVVKGAAWAAGPQGAVVCSAADHPSVLHAAGFLEKQGWPVRRLDVEVPGIPRLDQLEQVLRSCRVTLVSLPLANHDFGTVQPLEEAAALCRQHGAMLHVDATFAGGWTRLDMEGLRPDFVTLSPHRFYGPRGVGVLLRREGAPLAPLVHGGLQEGGLRAGAENVASIAGAAAAAAWFGPRVEQARERLQELSARLAGTLAGIGGVDVSGAAPGPRRQCNHLHVGVRGAKSEELVIVCDRFGLQVAGGTGCASPAARLSPALLALGVDEELVRGGVLFGLGLDTTAGDVDRAAEIFLKAVARVR